MTDFAMNVALGDQTMFSQTGATNCFRLDQQLSNAGYFCGCGLWVQPGIAHSCWAPRPQMLQVGAPHRCPVCDGKSQVDFNPDRPLEVDRSRTSWPCKPCLGTGVLWG